MVVFSIEEKAAGERWEPPKIRLKIYYFKNKQRPKHENAKYKEEGEADGGRE